MKRVALRLPAAIAAFAFINAAEITPLQAKPPAIYDEQAYAARDIAAAVKTASVAHKLVHLIFGANWCPD